MHTMILTNNPRVRDAYRDRFETDYRDCSYAALLQAVRDRVHRGARLLTHPLYGSVKPQETPFRSVLLETGNARESAGVSPGMVTDTGSVCLIEEAIAACTKFPDKAASYGEALIEDCMAVDLALFESAAAAAERSA